MEYRRKVIQADHSPESIADVSSIVIVEENHGLGHLNCKSFQLNGSIKQKLNQYKEITGKEWFGFDEQVVSTPIYSVKIESLNLGQLPKRSVCKATRDAQIKIDMLTAKAKRWFNENDVAKKLPREEQMVYLGEEKEVVVE